jgi:hypothetical protein
VQAANAIIAMAAGMVTSCRISTPLGKHGATIIRCRRKGRPGTEAERPFG